ncbi:hypothetical protein [Piscirickettsia litoralis]|uniref:Phasin domain-containing protein n=1 Tax=Piscirickettsia litoralis TaxID=1891921 RepID=A0ABX3A1I7_9GAMM|nr:hypothetical protein [Piscirickettsia litoralis]ODN42082.1 hypothetical protein BGC07_02855 [Piscirickettsia litoralis]
MRTNQPEPNQWLESSSQTIKASSELFLNLMNQNLKLIQECNECAEQYFKDFDHLDNPASMINAQKHYSRHLSEKLTKHALAICEMTGESTETALKAMMPHMSL